MTMFQRPQLSPTQKLNLLIVGFMLLLFLSALCVIYALPVESATTDSTQWPQVTRSGVVIMPEDLDR